MGYIKTIVPILLLILALSTGSSQVKGSETLMAVNATVTATPTPIRNLDELPSQLRVDSAQPLGTGSPRLEWSLEELLSSYNSGGLNAAKGFADSADIQMHDDKVLVVVHAEPGLEDKIVSQASSLGATSDGTLGSQVRLVAPINILKDLAALPEARFVGLPIKFHTNGLPSAGVISEVVGHSGADKWHESGFQGQGIKVGIIDIGFKGYLNLLRTELPSNVTTKCFGFICRTFAVEDDPESVDALTPTDHGTAIAELVYDMAPHAELYFATVENDIDISDATNWMMSQGVRIISFSLGKNIGRFDGEDITDKIVEGARSNNVLWVTAAGNEGAGHYESIFTDEDGDGWHEFGPGVELNPIEVAHEVGGVSLNLNWPGWPASYDDYDLYLFSETFDGSLTLLAASGNKQTGVQPPAERIFRGVPPASAYFAAIRRTRSDHPALLKMFSNFNPLGYGSPAMSLGIPAASRGAMTVGATNDGQDVIEDYSGQGPTPDGRIKPDLVAPDRVSTATYGTVGFPGTSASAPEVAGAAAVVLTAYPWLSAQQMQDYLEGRAKDLGDPGKDNVFGAGRLSLGPAPSDAVAPPLPAPEPELPPCIVESAHPYQDTVHIYWMVTNPDKDAEFTRVHFQRVETESCCDFINLFDSTGTINQIIRGRYPQGVWSTPLPGTTVKVNLQTDENVNGWGFCIDAVETFTGEEPTPTPAPPRPLPTPTPTPAPAGPAATPTPILPPLQWNLHTSYLPVVIGGKR